MKLEHCEDNEGDRKIGEFWEGRFCEIVLQSGGTAKKLPYANNVGLVMPDLDVQFAGRREWHEIKHKNPSPERSGPCFGLEKYRYDDFLVLAKASCPIFYTVHNHKGRKEDKVNNSADWITVNITELGGHHARDGWSYRAGKRFWGPIYYWPVVLWGPLSFSRQEEKPKNDWTHCTYCKRAFTDHTMDELFKCSLNSSKSRAT